MKLITQIIDTVVEVSCPDQRVLEALKPQSNHADHRVAPASRISLTVGLDQGTYHLPAGRKEIAPEIAAEAAWSQVSRQLQANLSSWLQITGVCIDHGDKRLLVLGEQAGFRRLLALHCLYSGLDVPSAAGVCFRNGAAIPYALPIPLSHSDLTRFKSHTGFLLSGDESRNEAGTKTYSVTPSAFGRKWIAEARRISAVAIATWNPGGWSGLKPHSQAGLLERILDSCHMPQPMDLAARLPLLQSAKTLAASTPAIELRLGRLEDAPALLTGYLSSHSDA